MYQIDNSSAAAVIPASTPAGTPGYFTDGNPATGVAPTILPAEFMNMVMMEILGVLSAAGVTPSKSVFTQLTTAIRAINKQAIILTDTGTAGAYAAANTPALTSLPASGYIQRINIANLNLGASTYSPDGLTAKPIYGLGLQPLQGGELPAGVAVFMYLVQAGVNGGNGAWILIESLGGSSQVATATKSQHAVPLGQAQTLVAAGPSIQGAFKNLALSTTGTNASVTITADEIIVENASNQYQTLRAISVTASTAGTLVNGLDTGTIAVSTWYSVWVIWNGTTTASLLSLSATAPTMPSGYTHKARVGWIRTDATANKYPLSFIQNGKNVQYKVATGSNVVSLPVIANGTAGAIATPPTWVAVGISSIVPPTASRIKLYGANTTVNPGTIIAAPNNSYAGTATGTPPPLVMSNAGSSPTTTYCEFVIESTNIYWASAGTAGQSLICLGWEDSL